jgi:hypothetical protein
MFLGGYALNIIPAKTEINPKPTSKTKKCLSSKTIMGSVD